MASVINVEFTGQQLIDAVLAVADNKAVIRREHLDGQDVFVLGQISAYPYENLTVTADGNVQIVPTKQYHSFTVAEGDCGKEVLAIGYGPEAVVAAIRNFSEGLQAQLLGLGTGQSGSPNITFEFEGQKYVCPAEAYDLSHIVLPDGRILSVNTWLESIPPQPQQIEVIGRINAVLATSI